MDCAQVTQDKHIKLHYAIEGLDTIIYRLEELIVRLQGGLSDPAKGQATKPLPSFIDVLNSGPVSIAERTADAHERINHLTGLLF